jgi:pyruvate ferredoxin oxidoreductase gamma subunit
VKEIRWHARAGQGAKTASQVLALALLRSGRYVQAFPDYGPERSGPPMRAYTRLDDRPIRVRYGVTEPDLVVVLDPSLLGPDAFAGLGPEGTLLVNAERPPDVETEAHVVCVPATRIAAAAGSSFVNVVMAGAAAATLGEPPLEHVLAAAGAVLGKKLAPEALETIRAAIAAGHGALQQSVAKSGEVPCAA